MRKQARDHQGTEDFSEYYVGLISGTSVDGIDAVVIQSNPIEAKASQPGSAETSAESTLGDTPIVVAADCFPIPPALQKQIHTLCRDDSLTPESLAQGPSLLAEVHQTLGSLLAISAENIIAKAGISKAQVIAIGSHGQTVKHQPPVDTAPGYSLQIGCAKTIAATTGITTISNFRAADMQNGGQGAPLAPAFHRLIASQQADCCAFLNLGGIANISVIAQQQLLLGYDTGPANTLMDAWIWHCKRQAYDRNGEWASTGKVSESLLAACLAEPFFQLAAPRSTGRELFNLSWLQRCLQQLDTQPDDVDVQATLLLLSALTISQEIEKLSSRPEIIYCCGGGSHNTALIDQLKYLLPDIAIKTTAALGIDVDYVEAALFAWLAEQHMRGQAIDLRTVTGADKPCILGERHDA